MTAATEIGSINGETTNRVTASGSRLLPRCILIFEDARDPCLPRRADRQHHVDRCARAHFQEGTSVCVAFVLSPY